MTDWRGLILRVRERRRRTVARVCCRWFAINPDAKRTDARMPLAAIVPHTPFPPHTGISCQSSLLATNCYVAEILKKTTAHAIKLVTVCMQFYCRLCYQNNHCSGCMWCCYYVEVGLSTSLFYANSSAGEESVPAKRQKQCSAAGKVTAGLVSHQTMCHRLCAIFPRMPNSPRKGSKHPRRRSC